MPQMSFYHYSESFLPKLLFSCCSMTTVRSWKYVLKNTPEDGETPLMRTPVSLVELLFTLKRHTLLHCAIILTDSQPALILTLGTVHQ